MEADKDQVETKSDVTPEAINAAGQSCLALATAITSLAQKDMGDEVRELTEQLRLTSRSIRWLIREGRSEPTGFSKINTKGIELDKDSKICQFMSEYLGTGERRAMDVIRKALASGFDKNEVFKAKEVLGVRVKETRNCKYWSLPGAAL